MLTSSFKLVYDNRVMRFSGIFRCIFTGRPLMWLIYNKRFYFIKFDRPCAIVIRGSQGSDKTSFAKLIQYKLRCMGLSVDLHDECSNESLYRKIAVQEIDDSTRKRSDNKLLDIIIYTTQDTIHSYAGGRRDIKIFNVIETPAA